MCCIIIQADKVTVSKIVNGTKRQQTFYGLDPMEAKKQFIKQVLGL